jgi:hypothetical protein
MYIESLELDINNISKYTREDIKNIYKRIALDCHPDKLCNIKDSAIKSAKIEKFKKASIGYKKALEDFDKYGELMSAGPNSYAAGYTTDDIRESYDTYKDFDFDIDVEFWHNVYNDMFSDKETIQNTFIDVAKLFFKKGIKKRDYYNPSTKVIRHDIILPVSYYDLHNTKKKRIQILLKGVEEPFNISILCKKEYPCLTRQYIDDNGVEHEIELKMMISNSYASDASDASDASNASDASDASDASNASDASDASDDGKYASDASYDGKDASDDTIDNCDAREDTRKAKEDASEEVRKESIKYRKRNNIYTHYIKNDIIDLMTTVEINIKDYLIGCVKVIKYIDDSFIDVVIKPFNLDNIVIKNKGLIGGALIIRLVLHNISHENWCKINEDNRKVFVKYLDDMFI